MKSTISEALKEIQEFVEMRAKDAEEREEHNHFRSILKMHYFIKGCRAWEPYEMVKWFQKEWPYLEKEELVQIASQMIIALAVEKNKDAFVDMALQLEENYSEAFEKEGIS